MALNFDPNAVEGDIYIVSTGKKYRYTNGVWKLYNNNTPSEGGAGGIGIATKLETPRTIELSGDVTGSAAFDGSQDIIIEVTSVGGGGSLGTAAALNAPITGDAGPTEVVLGNDSRLLTVTLGSAAEYNVNLEGDAGPTEVVLGNDSRLVPPTLGTGSTYNVPAEGNADVNELVLGSDTRLVDHSTYGNVVSYNVNLTGDAGADEVVLGNDSRLIQPTLGTAAALNVAVTGDAAANEVVKGDDSRLLPQTFSVALSDIADWPSSVSVTEVGYLDGLTANVQTQLGDIETTMNAILGV